MPDELLERLRRFQQDAFPMQRSLFRHLVDEGQHPLTLFIGCSDSRLVPYLLTGAGPENSSWCATSAPSSRPTINASTTPRAPLAPAPGGRTPLGAARRWVGFHGTAAAIEFAVLNLEVKRIIVCGHSHCGAIRALYGEVPAAANNLQRWLDLCREAALPVAEPGPEVLRRTEQRAIVLQLERLMDYPMVRERVEAGTLTLHGWHYVIEDGEVHVFDVMHGGFVPASQAENAGTGPYLGVDGHADLDPSGVPVAS